MNPPPLPQPAAQTCPNCGADVADGATFCPHCGAAMASGSSQSAGCFALAGQMALGCLALLVPALGACYLTASAIGSGEEPGVITKLSVGTFTLLISALCIWGILSRYRNRP